MQSESTKNQAVRLLIVDDDNDIRMLIGEYLKQHGYSVDLADNGDSMFEQIRSSKPDLIVLDIMMPGEDGFALCRKLHSVEGCASIPVIFLTALGDTADRVAGLELGADDYVIKPFQPRELLARIRAVLRRSGRFHQEDMHEDKDASADRYAYFNGWKLDIVARHLISPEGMIVNLSGAEYRLLEIFLENPQKVLSRDFIQDALQGQEVERSPFDRSLDVQVCRLRARLRDNGRESKLIKTVRGDGYVFSCPITKE